MKEKTWQCPRGHTFTLRSEYFACIGEYQVYLDPKIGADDSPCGSCTDEMQSGCILTMAACFGGEDV